MNSLWDLPTSFVLLLSAEIDHLVLDLLIKLHGIVMSQLLVAQAALSFYNFVEALASFRLKIFWATD